MSTTPLTSTVLSHRFADELPELALPWQAAETPGPRLLVLNEPLAAELGLDAAWLRTSEGLGLLTGTAVPEGATPVAQAYAGHQFGGYSPRLGDGRALLLGELVDGAGRLRDLHLKGSGRTPFSRGGDGYAGVPQMLREHVLSEAMHALGIPTTRSLGVVATGRTIHREVALPGAVLARVASSHLRVGSVQYARSLDDTDVLRRLADHAIARHHPAAAEAEQPYLALYEAVVAAQARLVAQWMLVGFVHGVMNTDNVTLSGETIDYGPCAFLDAYDPTSVFSSIDTQGRYAYAQQPVLAEWDLARLAEALLPLLHESQDEAVAIAVEALHGFRTGYLAAYADGMRAKLGLGASVDEATLTPLVEDLLALLTADCVDWTGFFRALAAGTARDLVLDRPAYDAWSARWLVLAPDTAAMDRVNPVRIPRNHLVEEALDAATAGDLAPFDRLLEAVTSPFDDRPGLERYAEPAPDTFGHYTTYCGT